MGGAREYPTEPLVLPDPLADAAGGRAWFRDTVGESGGEVYRLHARDLPDLYLKVGRGRFAEAVADEASRLRWVGAHAAHAARPPAVRGFVRDDAAAWLLTAALPGRTAWQVMTDEPAERGETVAALARHLAALHAIPSEGCPFDGGLDRRLAEAWRRIEAGEVDADDFGDDHEGWTPRMVWDEMTALLPVAPDLVVTHGDYSLDNILLSGGVVAGCIDWGLAGIADRYQDLAVLTECLDEFDGNLRGVFFDAYGLVAADERKLRLYRCLDEMF